MRQLSLALSENNPLRVAIHSGCGIGLAPSGKRLQNEDLGVVAHRVRQRGAIADRCVIDENGDMLSDGAAFVQHIPAQPRVIGEDIAKRRGDRGARGLTGRGIDEALQMRGERDVRHTAYDFRSVSTQHATGNCRLIQVKAMIRVCASCGQKNRVSAAHLSAQLRCGKCKSAIGPISEPLDADEEIFDEVIRDSKVPVLVDFWAAWCGPCVAAAPEVKKVAAEAAGRAIVLKVDTDRYQEIASRYGVRGIPNFVVLRGGQMVHQHAGVVSHSEMLRWLL